MVVFDYLKKRGQVKRGQAKRGQVKRGQVKRGQAKRGTMGDYNNFNRRCYLKIVVFDY